MKARDPAGEYHGQLDAMALSPWVFDVGTDDFGERVLANSMKGPVLVHYWAAGAAPCYILMPRLVRLATEYGGRFLLAMLNTDQHGRLAREHGVTSVPTVKVFVNGAVVATVHGAESDAAFLSVIDRHVARPSDAEIAAAVAAFERGQRDEAFAALEAARAGDPANLRVAVAHAKLLVLSERYGQAQTLLEGLPQAQRDDIEVRRLLVHVTFLATAAPPAEALAEAIAANPGDLEARFQLAARHLLADDCTAALDQLLEILERDRRFRNDAGRLSVIALLEALEDPDLAARYREKLKEALAHRREGA